MLAGFLVLIDDDKSKSKFIDGYYKYRYLMFNIANTILNDEYLAEDAVQEAFFRIAKNFSKVDDIDSTRTKNYYIVITKHVSLTMLKKEKAIMDENTINIALEREALKQHWQNDNIKQVVKSILQMDEKYKLPIYLYYIYGFSSREISELIGIKPATVRKQIERGKEILRRIMDGEDYQ